MLWAAKGKAGVLDDVTVTVDLRQEKASHWPFGSPDRRSRFEPQRVALENAKGEVLEELLQPRSSFQGHTLETPWTDLQLAYFAGCAMWTWRRLKVRFPADIATHSTEQTLYFDQQGLLKRHDYDVEITGGTAGAHYVSGLKKFSGIVFQTKRRIVPRQPNGHSVPEPLVVSIDLDQIVLS